jgi:hypothetical protein
LIETRFDVIPDWADERLNHQSSKDIEALCFRLLDGATLEELLHQSQDCGPTVCSSARPIVAEPTGNSRLGLR